MKGSPVDFFILYGSLALFGYIVGYILANFSQRAVRRRFRPGGQGLMYCALGLITGTFCALDESWFSGRTFADSHGAFLRAVTYFSCLGIGIEIAVARLGKQRKKQESPGGISTPKRS